MLANPAVQGFLMFLIGTALAVGDVHSPLLARLCWLATVVLFLVAFFQWLRWPGNYGRKLAGWLDLRWGGRISLRKAAEIVYSEARAKDSIWAHAAERLAAEKSPDGVLCYIAEVVKRDTQFYGRRLPSTHMEAIPLQQSQYGTIAEGAREMHLRDSTRAVFVDLEIDKKALRRALAEVRSNLKTTTPI